MPQPAKASDGSRHSLLPGLQMLRQYKLRFLASDLVAGLVLTTMLVPVGIAYAEASGIPGIYGLYATIVPLLVYALLGPSRIFVLGPDSSLAAIILAVVIPLSGGDSTKAVALAGMMAIVSGLVCILVGIFRLGFITDLISKPIRYGYMNGIALTVLISQLPRLFQLPIDGTGPVQDVLQMGKGLVEGQFNMASCLIGIASLAIIMSLKRFRRIPAIMIVVIAATVVTGYFNLDQNCDVQVLGALPHGLPSFRLPWTSLGDLQAVVIGGCAAALVSFADTSVLSRVYAAKSRSYTDPNQEMIALGAANLATGFFQGFAISSSSSRTPVAEFSGAKTQMTGVVAAAGVALLLMFGSGLLETLPISALAAVVIASAFGLFELRDLRRIFRIQRWEFWLSIGCFLGVVGLGAIPGIGLSIVIAVIEFLWDGWRPHYAVLGRVDGIRGYHDIKRYPQARLVPGLVLFRWDAPLFFANAELFHLRIAEAVNSSPTPVKRVIVAAEPVTSVDVTSADMIAELKKSLSDAGIELHLAELKDPVKDTLKRLEIFDLLGSGIFHPTMGAAVDAYLEQHAVDWKP